MSAHCYLCDERLNGKPVRRLMEARDGRVRSRLVCDPCWRHQFDFENASSA